MQYYLWALKDQNVSVVTTCFHILQPVPPHDLQQPFFCSRGATFALAKISLKRLAFLIPIIGTFSKIFPCSLSGANSECISDSIFLSFENTG